MPRMPVWRSYSTTLIGTTMVGELVRLSPSLKDAIFSVATYVTSSDTNTIARLTSGQAPVVVVLIKKHKRHSSLYR